MSFGDPRQTFHSGPGLGADTSGGGGGGEDPPPASPRDANWPTIAYAFPGISTGTEWNGSTLPSSAEFAAMCNASACENADKNGIIWPTTLNGPPRRSFKGTFDGATGNVTTPVAASTVVAASTLLPYTAGDWFVIGNTGTYNFDGTSGGATKTQGEYWIYDGTNFVIQATCPHMDVPYNKAIWTTADSLANKQKAALAGGTYNGHLFHFTGWWHAGGAFWLLHSLWSQTDPERIKALISGYLHWHVGGLKQHFAEVGKIAIQMDAINEPFDEDITISSAVKEPGLRGWNRTFPVYTSGESAWHYAATLVTDWGATNIDRIIQLWLYTFQVIHKYFPDIPVGINDFGTEGRRYVTSSLQSSTADVNGNTSNQTVWVGHQQGGKGIAAEYYYWKMLQAPQVPLILDPVLDAGATWVQPKSFGLQFHLEPKNQMNLYWIARMANRMSHLGPEGVELYLSEINHRGEHLVTQNPATITITTGGAGDTITAVNAYYPTTQTSTGDSLISSPVAWSVSNNNTADALAAAIAAGSGTHGYSAVASSNVVTIFRTGSPRGFDIGTSKTGAITLTNVNSRVNNPTNIQPQFRQYYQTSSLSGNRTLWRFGWTSTNTKNWDHGAWITESFIRCLLRNSYIRYIKWWTPDGGSGGDPVSLWNYARTATTESYAAMNRNKASVDWIPPSERVIPNWSHIDFTWYPHLANTRSNVTVESAGTGLTINNTTGTCSFPWTWWSATGLLANDYLVKLQFQAPANPASGTVLYSHYTDANNKKELFFSNSSGQLSLRSITGGVTAYTTVIGTVTASAQNVIVVYFNPTGAISSLNGAAAVTSTGTTYDGGTTVSFGFDHAGANGYNGARFVYADHRAGTDSDFGDSDIVAWSVARSTANPWPLWDGTPPYPTLITEND